MQKADESEFHTYVNARLDRWRRSAFLLCQDWYLADDLVSITITKLYRNWPTVCRADNRDAYAHTVLTRCWLTERRRPWWRLQRLPGVLPEQTWVPPDRVVDRDALATMLRSLGPASEPY